MKKPRRSTRVDAPPPPSEDRRPASSMAPATMQAHADAAAWWDGTYAGVPAAVTSSNASPAEELGSQAVNQEFASPSSDPTYWGKDARPTGGFVNFLEGTPPFPFPQQFPHHTPMYQNFHFGSSPIPTQLAPVPARPPLSNKNLSPSPNDLSSSHLASNSETNHCIDVDGPEGDEMRTRKRLIWTPTEDERLMSAWINNTTDSINGINKKNEQYWSDVVNAYNLTTPRSRWRSAKQAKDRWHTVNRLVYQFQYSWNKAYRIYSSGQSDDQLMDKAHAFYTSDWGGQFMLIKVWKSVRDKPKWQNYNRELEEAKKKRSNNDQPTENTSSVSPPEDEPRPIGTKQAKAQRCGKGKSKEATAEIEELEKYEQIQLEASKNRSMMLEKQERLSAEKLETAKLSHLVALENKEARKHDKESEMWRTYRAMLTQDTNGMSENVKDEYVKALKVMREKLSGNKQ